MIGIPSGVAVTKDTCEKYFISIPVEEQPIQLKQYNYAIGIDMGSESFVTTSNGKKLISPKPFKYFKKKLKKKSKMFK